ncbi:hypothetical protein MHPYR_180049 [uncultured Mycobacterium sp.]|uniref:Minor tail protein n=1 Tax=uncultured Mycobacterium sp. TaxID=171292 RepID=A0A1Y5P8X5_9MYCO|nr:hypothetical protein MHPYR_180049 [uncultured Mycobacterium sp.]
MASNELAVWNADIQSGDRRRVAKAARRIADEKAKVPPEWIFTRCDKFWRPAFSEMGPDIIEASGTDPRNASGSAMIKLKSGSTHNAYLAECSKTFVGVKVETAGIKMPYYVKKHSQKYENSAWTYTSELAGIADIFKYLIIFPTWFLPIQVQPISHAVLAGPIVTVLESVISECALRIQSGIMDFFNNALSLNPDMRTWVGTMLQALNRDGLTLEALHRMLRTPMYVVRGNPFLDGSPLWAKTVRMVPLSEVIEEATQSYGIDVSIELWEVGDPQPDAFAHLDQPTYVVRVRDRTQIVGPTKTIIDSVLRTAVDLSGSLGVMFGPLIKGVPGMEGVFVAPALGINYHEPWTYLVAPDPGEDGSVLTCEIVDHTQTGWQHIIGGKSPKWLNDLINAWFSFVIDAVQIVLGFTGIPSDLLSGFLNVGAPPGNWGGTDIHPGTMLSSRSRCSSYTTGAVPTARTTRPWNRCTRRDRHRTTSRRSSPSSRSSGSRGAGPRHKSRSATTRFTRSAARCSRANCSRWSTRAAPRC